MNPHILMIIDHQLNPEKYTQEQLDKNASAAYAANAAAAKAAYAAKDTASWSTAAVHAAATWSTAAVHAASAFATAYWLNEHFNITGENKQDYIDKINKEAQS